MLTLTSLSDIQSCSIIKRGFVPASPRQAGRRSQHESHMKILRRPIPRREARGAPRPRCPGGAQFTEYNFNLVDVCSSCVLTSAERLFRSKLVRERLWRRGILIQAGTRRGGGTRAVKELYDFSRGLLAKRVGRLRNLMGAPLAEAPGRQGQEGASSAIPWFHIPLLPLLSSLPLSTFLYPLSPSLSLSTLPSFPLYSPSHLSPSLLFFSPHLLSLLLPSPFSPLPFITFPPLPCPLIPFPISLPTFLSLYPFLHLLSFPSLFFTSHFLSLYPFLHPSLPSPPSPPSLPFSSPPLPPLPPLLIPLSPIPPLPPPPPSLPPLPFSPLSPFSPSPPPPSLLCLPFPPLPPLAPLLLCLEGGFRDNSPTYVKSRIARLLTP
ncbi:hypothetical protein C7M84_022514 [Penaeus vannamei]|uniref:Uncharacterized protein n=1 Tax=Penaeus vannamei TaxID=6689 RepID=A0A3R7PEW2_PENVA|nr:hypothetical protein C7M84_022514 [Penaeus vannamei]